MKKDNNNVSIINEQNNNESSKEKDDSILSNPDLTSFKNEYDTKKEGKYRIGRWTKEEHIKFLKGIIKYGNDWKMVEKIVKTRTSSQSRSHAQKFFLKFKNFDEKSLYEFIAGEFCLGIFLDKQLIKLNLEERKKLVNTFISNSNLFENSKNKRRKKRNNKNNPMEDYNKLFRIESKDDNKSFHSDEDEDEISSTSNKNFLKQKTKRKKIFKVVKCIRYKYSKDCIKNLDKNINKNIKMKFHVQKNKSEKNSNNTGNNNNNLSEMKGNYIINNNIININNTKNLDLNSLNIFNCNINTININNINYINNSNETNKNICENSDKNIIDNNNFLSFSQKNLSYDFLRNSYKNSFEPNLLDDENDEDDELSSLYKQNKTLFVSPL